MWSEQCAECDLTVMYWSSDFRESFRELSICYNTRGQGELQSGPAKRFDRTFERTPWPPRTPSLCRGVGRRPPDLVV